MRTTKSPDEQLQMTHHVATEDDVIRLYGSLIALSKFCDQIELFGKIVCRDKWLRLRVSQGWWQSKLRFLL